MGNERIVLCGGLPAPRGAAEKAAVRLSLSGRQNNVNLKLSDISERMVANLPPELIDPCLSPRHM